MNEGLVKNIIAAATGNFVQQHWVGQISRPAPCCQRLLLTFRPLHVRRKHRGCRAEDDERRQCRARERREVIGLWHVGVPDCVAREVGEEAGENVEELIGVEGVGIGNTLATH